MRDAVIAVDLGSSNTKVIVFTPDEGVRAVAAGAARERPAEPARSEGSPGRWWRNLRELVPAALAQAGLAPRDVAAVTTTGMVPAVVALDAAAEAIGPAILQNDTRASLELELLRTTVPDDRALAITGATWSQQSVAPKLAWLARHRPQEWARVRWVCGSYDWALVRMGAEPHVERNWAIESGLFELDGTVSPAFAALGLDPALVPPRRRSGERVGTLGARQAAELGLDAGAELIVGGADHVLSAFAAGVAEPGEGLVKLGSAADVLACVDRPVVDGRLYFDEHPVPGRWLPNGCMASSGTLVQWIRELIGDRSSLELDREAADRDAAQLLMLPHFIGEKSPYNDPALRGVIAGLRLDHDGVDLYRAGLEAVAYGTRAIVDVLADHGLSGEGLRVTNGGSANTLWKQILADVLGRPVHPVLNHPGASLGAAVVAAHALGGLGGLGDVQRTVRLGEPHLPDPARHARYAERYGWWLELVESTRQTSHRLAGRDPITPAPP